jgi:CBS-domain-containing membrane protein
LKMTWIIGILLITAYLVGCGDTQPAAPLPASAVTFPTLPATDSAQPGDVDGDNRITRTDMLKITLYVQGVVPRGAFIEEAADTNKDGIISEDDATFDLVSTP